MLAVLVAIVVALAFMPGDAFAASSKTVNNAKFTTATKTLNKKATTVKAGTTKLTVKKGQGYIKFKATKTKTYSFTFSNVKAKNGASAFVEVQTTDSYDPKYSFLTDVKTKGGKSDVLWLSVNGKKISSKKAVDKPIASRTGKLKLAKGEWVYFYFYSGTTKTTATLKIK